MSAESRNQAVAGFVAAVQEALDAFRSAPDGAPGFPAAGARKYLGDVAPNAALLLEGLGGGASRCVVRIGAPFVLHVELPELAEGKRPAPAGDFRGSLIHIGQAFEMDQAAVEQFAAEVPDLVKKAFARLAEQHRTRMMQEMAAVFGEVPPWNPPVPVEVPVVPAAPSKRAKRGA